ncbi:fasciclin domain-containing protein [Anoxynatronum sibiricum]|uniref:Fasciclin domain-containing protein n=1 Tax=Anoxynatronum sibiricum TaxID=210623 RepID=A0ABU9VPB3_9CLOT
MKSQRVLVMLLVLSLVFFGISSQVFAEENDIVDIAVNDGRFTVLTAALQRAGLVETLQGEGPFTVFAPTDDAFTALLAALDVTAEELLAQPALADVLLYHVVSGKVMSTDLSDGMQAATVGGQNVTIDLDGGVFVNESQVIIPDIEASNGVIHVIDAVLVPAGFQLVVEEAEEQAEVLPSIVDIAVNDGRFTVLTAALQRAGLVETLQGEGPFTVFAPTDDAFTALLAALDVTAEELLAQPALADVLLYHVVSGKVMSTDLSDGMQAATVGGQNVMIDLDGGVFVNESQVIIPDIEASNGVIHVIDAVLVPAGFQLVMEEAPTPQPVEEPVVTEAPAQEPIPQTGDAGMMMFGLMALAGVGGLTLTRRKK